MIERYGEEGIALWAGVCSGLVAHVTRSTPPDRVLEVSTFNSVVLGPWPEVCPSPVLAYILRQ